MRQTELRVKIDPPTRTHNWPVPMWESVVRIEFEPFAVAVRRTEHEANQVAIMLSKATEMAELLQRFCDSIKDDARPMTNRQHDALVPAERLLNELGPR